MRLLAAAVTVLLLSGCGLLPKEVEEAPPPIEPPQKSIKEIFAVKRGAISERVQLRAMVTSANEATLFFKQAGRLKRVHVKAGDKVKAGQLLAEQETGDLQTRVQLSEINLQKLKLRFEQAQRKAQFKGGPDEIDLKVLELDLKAAELDLNMKRTQLNDARLYAPFDGDVTVANGNAGETVQAYQALVTVSDPSDLTVRAEVDDSTLVKLQPGMKVQLVVSDLGDAPMEATLVQVPDPYNDPPPPQGRLRLVKIATAKAQPLKRGMVGRAFVVLQAKPDVLLLPNSALRTYAGRTYVLVVDGNSRREVDVAVGIVGETESEITKGLKEGQQVMGR